MEGTDDAVAPTDDTPWGLGFRVQGLGVRVED
jgi:hypothetical protein